MILGALLWVFALVPLTGSNDEVDFRREVWPILDLSCMDCHSDDPERARLDTRAGLFEGLGATPVVPGDPDASRLYQLVTLDPNDSDRMPKDGLPLAGDEIEILRRWIEEGASWSDPKGSSKPKSRSTRARTPRPTPAQKKEPPRADDDPFDAALKRLKNDVPVSNSIDFARDIRPILSDNCFFCHGPDRSQRQARLRLDTKEGAFRTRRGVTTITAGDVGASEVARRILADDELSVMPPLDSNQTLDDREKRLITAWIEQGAGWEEHWAFVPPTEPEVPLTDPSWERNAIDAFVAARLKVEGLTPNPEADRHTLIRRVTLDLTGLPPTREEIDAFVADESPEAYENLVDRLLASERHGEHQARFWLDAARYGDTHGLHLDNYREMWPFRDWVVRAFNENMPYDQFALEQLAGDLLEEPTLDQLVASGFNRCHVTTNEGGSILEEVYVRNVVDRVSTTGTVFMGLTLGCAVCHDHKFDPVSQKEFYELFAFFNNLDGSAMDGNVKNSAPAIPVPTLEQLARQAEIAAQLTTVDGEIEQAVDRIEYADPLTTLPCDEGDTETTVWIDDGLPAGARIEGDGIEWVEAPQAPVHSGRRAMRRQSQGNQQHFFRNADQKLRIGLGDRLFAWVWLDPENPPREIMVQYNSDGDAGWRHRAFWGENLIGYGRDASTERRHQGPLPSLGEWTRLEIDPLDVGLRPGMVVHGVAFTQFDGTSYWDTIGIESSVLQEAEDFVWIDDALPPGAQPQGDGGSWQWITAADGPVLRGEKALRRSGRPGLHQDFFTEADRLRLQRGDTLFAHVWLDPNDPPRGIQLQFNNGNWSHRARWGVGAHGEGAGGGADFRAGDLPALGEWVRLEVDLASVGLKPGEMLNGWAFTQVGGTVTWDHAGLHTWGPPDERFRQSQLIWEHLAVADDSLPKPVREAALIPAGARNEDQHRRLRRYYLRYVHGDSRTTLAPFEARVLALNQAREALEKQIPTTLIMRERAEAREAFVLERGQYDARGKAVERATPRVLPPMPEDLARNRLGLARWLTSPSHPLMARVAVNRFWQRLFGVGLVKTSEDFGNQGEPPSHPELLDWLATQFIADGWDIKKTMKRLVMSATYRQSSALRPELLARDRENRLLARGPRYRLDAEMIRDQALAVSGLLVNRLGGPSVKPPQPDGLWFAVGYSGSNTVRFSADQGPDKVHRRTLYTFVKRTAPPPQMATFDAPNREACCVRRERTNTPLQALLLMNDPQFIEAARALAARLLREASSDRERAALAFELATCRPPRADELDVLVEFARAEHAAFESSPDQARSLVEIGESPLAPDLDVIDLATWTLVGNLILNLDEVINKS